MKKPVPFLLAAATAVCLLAGHAATAQNNDNDGKRRVAFKSGIGVKGGLNVANITIDNDGNVSDKRAIPSFNIGVYADVALLPVLSVQPGLFLSGKGAKFTLGDDGSSNYARVTARPIYVELPVNVLVKLPLVNKVKLFFGAGPYLAMGIGGKNKVDGKLLGVSYSDEEDINYSNDGPDNTNGNAYEGDFKRFDAGFNVLGGLEISHFTLNANYGFGAINVKPGSTNGVDNKYQNRVVSVQVGFLF